MVPEILEPSLQLSAAVLENLNLTAEEINEVIGDFRRNHMAELRQLTELSGGSLGYGLSENKSEKEGTEGKGGDESEEEKSADAEGVIKVAPVSATVEPVPA